MKMRLLALTLLCAAPLAAQLCTFNVSPSQLSISADAYTGSILVTGTGACGGYTATSSVPWLHITSGPSGASVPSSVTFTVDTNPGATSRSAAMNIALNTVIVTQAGASCNFGLTPATQSFTVSGGTGTVNVQSSCAWTLSPDSTWITFPGSFNGKATGNSSGPQTYTVDANACVAARSGNIVLVTNLPKPPTLAITQDGSPANLTLSATTATADSTASDGRISVNTGDGCPWTAFSDATWLTIYPGSTGGTGNGGISYHLLANTSATRSGSIHVGNLTYTVTQQSASAPPPVLSSE